MRTETTTVKYYKFEELEEGAQEKAIEKLFNINVDFEWWDFVYEDAENIGLKITAFDIDRGSYVEGDALLDEYEMAHQIKENHGETCETYKTAVNFIKERDQIVNDSEKDENGDHVDEYKLDQLLDECEAEFMRDLKNDYLTNLRNEYEYLTSEESVKETILANEYEFNEEGDLI